MDVEAPISKLGGDPVIWIEAVAPSSTKVLDSRYRQAVESVALTPANEIIFRYTQSIDERWKKFNSYLEVGIVKNEDCLVVAVSGSNLPFPSEPGRRGEDIPSIGKALYGLGYGRLSGGYNRIPRRPKSSGSPIETDLFCND